MRELEKRWGVLFQDGALFSSLTVAQNIEVPIKEHFKIPLRLMDEISAVKVGLVGLPGDSGEKYPAQLSGGMRKRAGLARALALDPEIVFLDEPTAGLDPIAAGAFDELIRDLRASLDLTVFMVTHDLDSLNTVCDRVAALADGRVVAVGPMQAMLASEHPWVKSYFGGKRAHLSGSVARLFSATCRSIICRHAQTSNSGTLPALAQFGRTTTLSVQMRTRNR